MQAAFARPLRLLVTGFHRALRLVLTSGVSSAPEDDGAILVLLGTEHIVELQGEAVQVTDVQRAEVVVESVVEEGVVDGEVVRRRADGGRLDGSRTFSGSLRSFPGGGLDGLAVGEDGLGRGRVDVRSQV